MKKNSIKLTGALAASLCACCTCLLSCSKDDADSNGSSVSYPTENNSVITTNSDGENVMLSSIDSWLRINYDEACLPIYCYDYGDDYQISYDPYEITSSSWGCTLSTKFYENSGYLSELVIPAEWDNGETETMTCDFTYDSSWHLTGLKGTIVDNYEGKKYTQSCTGTYTWNGGNLTVAKLSFKGSDYSASLTFNIEYGDETNQYRQPTVSFAEATLHPDDGLGLFAMCFLNYLGVGTANLPTFASISVTEKELGEEEEESSESDSFSYTKNSDGTIATEVENRDTYYYYSYYTAETSTDSGTDPEESESLSSAARPSRSHGTIGSHDWRTRIHAAARHAAENAAVE